MPDAARVLEQAAGLPRRAAVAVRSQWRYSVKALPIKDDTVVYEAFGGRGMLCHPEAIFRHLLDAPDLQHLRHVWVLDDPAEHRDLVRRWKADPRVRFVRRESFEYARLISTARYLVNNATFPVYFSRRSGQVYLNTWHGTPLKHMGYDEPGGAAAARNVVRNFLMADWLLSGSPYMTRQMYEGGYRLVNVFRGKVLEAGNPRTDRMLAPGARAEARAALRASGTAVTDDDRVVLFAPTWRGASFGEPDDVSDDLRRQVQELRELLPGHRVLLKVHQQVLQTVRATPGMAELLVSGELPANLVLSGTDVLVTDFSSIFFDALPAAVPVVFFCPDLDDYSATRGLYIDPEELPGPVFTDVASVAAAVSAVGTGGPDDPLVTHGERYDRALRAYAPFDDGAATRRVVDVVFRGKDDRTHVHDITHDDRETVLVYLGGMRPNGITTSALNLLRNIDHERFDVTVLYPYAETGERAATAAAIPDEVRRLARVGNFNAGPVNRARRRRLLDHGGDMTPKDLRTMLHLLAEEWERCVGDARFDYLVDFSGYSPFWTFLMAEVPCRSRSVWMHNDLLADQMREVDGAQPFKNHLGAVFAAYRYYDHLVSVSPSLREINAANLGRYAPAEKFTYARNTIDGDRVLRLAQADPELVAAWPGDHVLEPVETEDGPAETAEALARCHGVPRFEPEIARRLALRHARVENGLFTFVAVGRVSPEKNHERLVRAFAEVHARHPHTRLVVIGDGPLRGRNVRLAKELGVGDVVTFTGLLENPFALMATCDAFVISSDYEGQPMVILEALVLGLPVVSTAFGSVHSALPEGAGLVVDRDVPSLAAGMVAAVGGEVPAPPFDAAAYNATAMEEFYGAIGAAR